MERYKKWAQTFIMQMPFFNLKLRTRMRMEKKILRRRKDMEG